MQVEACATPLLTVDAVDKNSNKSLSVYSPAMLERLIQEEKLNGCHECVIRHPEGENIPV